MFFVRIIEGISKKTLNKLLLFVNEYDCLFCFYKNYQKMLKNKQKQKKHSKTTKNTNKNKLINQNQTHHRCLNVFLKKLAKKHKINTKLI